MNRTNVPKSMFAQQVCVLSLCPLPSLCLDKHVEGLQSRVGRLSVQDGLREEHCTPWGAKEKEMFRTLVSKGAKIPNET